MYRYCTTFGWLKCVTPARKTLMLCLHVYLRVRLCNCQRSWEKKKNLNWKVTMKTTTALVIIFLIWVTATKGANVLNLHQIHSHSCMPVSLLCISNGAPSLLFLSSPMPWHSSSSLCCLSAFVLKSCQRVMSALMQSWNLPVVLLPCYLKLQLEPFFI